MHIPHRHNILRCREESRRPFARIKTVIEKRLEPRGRQQASYVAVETCKDTKAAVLTLLVRLPGNHETGYPSPGRTGVCFGSTIVKMNSSKIKNKKTKESSSTTRRRNHTEDTVQILWATYVSANCIIIKQDTPVCPGIAGNQYHGLSLALCVISNKVRHSCFSVFARFYSNVRCLLAPPWL